MLIRLKTVFALTLVIAFAALSGLMVGSGLGGYSAHGGSPAAAVSAAQAFEDTGYRSPTASLVDAGGDGDGFELGRTRAYGNDARAAANLGGPGDRHRYFGYGFSIPAGSIIDGIRVRLDWWMGGAGGRNSLGVELSWDGGTNWTAMKTDAVEADNEHTAVLGGAADTWGRVWTADELSDANFSVRVTCNCSGGPECDDRDFFLDWVPVNVYYVAP